MAHSVGTQERNITSADIWRAVQRKSWGTVVVKYLDHPNPDIVAKALEALIRDKKDELEKGNGRLRWRLPSEKKLVEVLLQKVQSDNEDLANDAARLLRLWRDTDAERPLLAFLRICPSIQRMEKIIEVLGDIGTQECVPHLCRLLLETKEPTIRTAIFITFIEKEQMKREENGNPNFYLSERDKQELFVKLVLGQWSADDETLDFFAEIATSFLIRKILKELPPPQFNFRKMVTRLDKEFLGDRPVELLKKAQEHFEKGLFEDAAINATMAGERMLESFGYYLKEFGIEVSGPMAGNRLDQARKGLNKRDPAGRSMGVTERLEWYVLSLFETIHLFRNVVHHEAEEMPRLPEWMGTDRTNKKNSAEYARHILITSLQAAIELQLLMKHKTESLAPAS